jgi:hypothetical protein
MSIRTKHRIEFGFFGAALVLCLMVWRGTRAGGRTEETPIHSYGERLNPEARTALEVMNRELRNARDVLEIGSQRVLIENPSRKMNEYHFSGSTLWLNQQPVILNVNAFNFEFRDERGNLLTHRSENTGCVRTIAYTIRIQSRRAEVFANSRTAVPSNQGHPRDLRPAQVAFARSR